MRDVLIELAGAVGIVIAFAHSWLGETRIFANVPASLKSRDLLRVVWQNGALAWLSAGVLLIAEPSLGSDVARKCIIANAVLIYGSAAVANAWHSRGRHFGWTLLAAATALAIAGL